MAHEILISEEETYRCNRRGDYYAIKSMLPELHEGVKMEQKELKKEFSSADCAMSFEGTQKLLKRHWLMVDNGSESELLR